MGRLLSPGLTGPSAVPTVFKLCHIGLRLVSALVHLGTFQVFQLAHS